MEIQISKIYVLGNTVSYSYFKNSSVMYISNTNLTQQEMKNIYGN